MNYIYCILAVLVVGLFTLVAVRLGARRHSERTPAQTGDQSSRRVATRRGAQERGAKFPLGHKVRESDLETRSVLNRELRHVRTPWGWSHHEKLNRVNVERPGLSDSMHAFINRLTREKELVSAPLSNPRVSGSLRALLEDRYGRVNRQSMGTIEYQKVKPPRLRDPRELHDQMDNFDSREAERIRHKLKHVMSMNGDLNFAVKGEAVRYVDIKDMKQPWGW